MRLHRSQPDAPSICAVFVHAGAGFHSHANEKTHLSVVRDAASIAMAMLKNGAGAVDAVEMAVRLMEDRDVTNAGYGSNLTIDGRVECDALIVDHLGRSGAVGCISNVKNPVSVARLVLDASSKPLSLQRVPPNLLVGRGAVDFAISQGVQIVPHDYLISDNSRHRWQSWNKDLMEAAEEARLKEQNSSTNGSSSSNLHLLPNDRRRPSHAQVESSQAMSDPYPSPITPGTLIGSQKSGVDVPLPVPIPGFGSRSANVSRQATEQTSYPQYIRAAEGLVDGSESLGATLMSQSLEDESPAKRRKYNNAPDGAASLSPALSKAEARPDHTIPDEGEDDHVTDTVGAIAIDSYGNIAAASSSGGIGMKHKGRCGPAALNGIGAAVIPIDPDDSEETCVATVTSGTGEHMATTAAAATAAERIYFGIRKQGSKIKACEENEALRSMIENDFMKHPGVKNQPCIGALGVLAVKRSKHGVYFYFGHNTDSFALASMSSDDSRASVLMSRNKGNSSIAQGGRIAHRTRSKA